MEPCGPCHPLPLKERENKTVLVKLIYIEGNINCSEVNPQLNLLSIFFCNGWKLLLLLSRECVSKLFCKLMNPNHRKIEVNSHCDTKNSDK